MDFFRVLFLVEQNSGISSPQLNTNSLSLYLSLSLSLSLFPPLGQQYHDSTILHVILTDNDNNTTVQTIPKIILIV